MKVYNRINEALNLLTSEEDMKILDRDLYLMDRSERKEQREIILKKINNLISRNNAGLRVLNNAVKVDVLDNSIFEIFEEYIEDVNSDLTKIADRL